MNHNLPLASTGLNSHDLIHPSSGKPSNASSLASWLLLEDFPPKGNLFFAQFGPLVVTSTYIFKTKNMTWRIKPYHHIYIPI